MAGREGGHLAYKTLRIGGSGKRCKCMREAELGGLEVWGLREVGKTCLEIPVQKRGQKARKVGHKWGIKGV